VHSWHDHDWIEFPPQEKNSALSESTGESRRAQHGSIAYGEEGAFKPCQPWALKAPPAELCT
jgi:hypothetical protein